MGRFVFLKLTTRRPSTSTRHCSVRLSSIVENSPLLPLIGVWAVSQSQVKEVSDLMIGESTTEALVTAVITKILAFVLWWVSKIILMT